MGVQGMGGLGKTVLAAALARDNEVRRQFPDGIIWLTVGTNPDCLALYQRLANTLGETYAYQRKSRGAIVRRRSLNPIYSV
ncbi:NB-ARC domain-containing protein [Spirulina sp. CCNP1310]|uniref:NB-ARC domain-containing protein n=1 Tax=Spirulina sp. CCNP1310 TaxID=3110249 RepID=UPI002B1EE7EB|nr:NB-ARC domain-containing protein [Spirulina sp. CCNP1310]MEA5419162.1 NB-ARC domain-containing protein [Spirulina sp. CCNP1310]